MKKMLLFFSYLMLLMGCSWNSNDYQECYEPFFLNETEVNVSLFFGSIENAEEDFQTVEIEPGDTAHNTNGTFPFLHKEGLGYFESNLYDVRLIFHTQPQKCLTFKGDELQKKDIRNFASYENIGSCRYCMMRGQSEPEAMLYRINEDLLKQANHCE